MNYTEYKGNLIIRINRKLKQGKRIIVCKLDMINRSAFLDLSWTVTLCLTAWFRVVSRAFRVGPGSGWFGLKFVKMFRADFAPAYTSLLYHSKSRFFSFLKCICSAHCCDYCEWSDCDFSSANSICKHSCGFLFSARISVAHFFRRPQPWGN